MRTPGVQILLLLLVVLMLAGCASSGPRRWYWPPSWGNDPAGLQAPDPTGSLADILTANERDMQELGVAMDVRQPERAAAAAGRISRRTRLAWPAGQNDPRYHAILKDVSETADKLESTVLVGNFTVADEAFQKLKQSVDEMSAYARKTFGTNAKAYTLPPDLQ